MLKKILIVDDSNLVHSMYRQMLKKFDCEFLDAMNGMEALTHVEAEQDIDLILLDVDMPVMNGLKFLEQYKENQTGDGIPIIIISTLGKEKDIKRGLELGASGYIIKPFEQRNLHNLIDKLSETWQSP
jgi:two-component system chemotaxis response regulator CheY